MIVWLVSPSIDFDGNTGEMLFCQVQEAWDNGATLDVMVSTDFDGTSDPWDATWTPFTDTRPWDSGQPGDTPTGFGNWESFQWDLSSFSGTGYIAFRYTGSDSGNQTTTYAIDDVRVIADE